MSEERKPQKCPKCGSGRIDHPRSYRPQGSSMVFKSCAAYCLDCKHEEAFPSHQAALDAWRNYP